MRSSLEMQIMRLFSWWVWLLATSWFEDLSIKLVEKLKSTYYKKDAWSKYY